LGPGVLSVGTVVLFDYKWHKRCFGSSTERTTPQTIKIQKLELGEGWEESLALWMAIRFVTK